MAGESTDCTCGANHTNPSGQRERLLRLLDDAEERGGPDRRHVGSAPIGAAAGRRRKSIEWMRRGRPRPDLIFPSAVETPLDDSRVRKVFGSIIKKAERRHRNLHAMRHTFISLLLQNGESPAYAQKQAGHKSMDITINVYGHFMPGGNRAAVDRLDDQPHTVARAS